ncbi:MAG TPA: MFS transporter, partial [Thermoleophilia bacterium]|nr:MFS transporter [Thermoleophilia bacterium]
MSQAPGTTAGPSGRLAVLRLRDFRRVFLAQSVSVFGDGITPVALTFAVLGLTGSATDLGLVLAAQSLPLAALALVGGVWADRLPRAALMVTSDLVRAAVQITGATLLLTGMAQIWQLALLAAIHG